MTQPWIAASALLFATGLTACSGGNDKPALKHPCDLVGGDEVAAATHHDGITAHEDGPRGCSYRVGSEPFALITRRSGSDSTEHFLEGLKVGGYSVKPFGRARLVTGPTFHIIVCPAGDALAVQVGPLSEKLGDAGPQRDVETLVASKC